MSDGYDSDEGHRAFQEAVMAWRRGGSVAERPASKPTVGVTSTSPAARQAAGSERSSCFQCFRVFRHELESPAAPSPQEPRRLEAHWFCSGACAEAWVRSRDAADERRRARHTQLEAERQRAVASVASTSGVASGTLLSKDDEESESVPVDDPGSNDDDITTLLGAMDTADPLGVLSWTPSAVGSASTPITSQPVMDDDADGDELAAIREAARRAAAGADVLRDLWSRDFD